LAGGRTLTLNSQHYSRKSAGSLTWAGGTSGSTWLTRNLQLSYRLFAAMSLSLGLNVYRHELPAALGAEGRAFVASALELSIKGSEDVD
jgi:hypothetical protein